MTPTEAVDYVRRAHNAESDTFFADGEIYELWRARSNKVLSIIGLAESTATKTTTTNTQAYSHPTNAIHIKTVLYDNKDLKNITMEEWNRRFRSPSSSDAVGTPDRYVDWGNELHLIPIPASAVSLKIYFTQQESTITAGSTFITPESLHPHIGDGVIEDMHLKDKNPQSAQFYKARWDNDAMPAFYEFKSKRARKAGYFVVQVLDDC